MQIEFPEVHINRRVNVWLVRIHENDLRLQIEADDEREIESLSPDNVLHVSKKQTNKSATALSEMELLDHLNAVIGLTIK
jgi:hypothetical protein